MFTSLQTDTGFPEIGQAFNVALDFRLSIRMRIARSTTGDCTALAVAAELLAREGGPQRVDALDLALVVAGVYGS